MIHVIIGPPCAGKSTYIDDHAQDGDLRIDFDRIAQTLGSPSAHESVGLVRKAAFDAREAAIRAALDDTESESWIIHSFPNENQMKIYEDAGAEIIELDPGRDECLARAEADGRPQTSIDGINKWYENRKGGDMSHLYKTFSMKAADNGLIEGYFSTYDQTPDSYGDIIAPGAFTETFKKREESGHPFPLCFNHDFSAVIGAVKSIEDTERGPFIKAEFLDTQLAQDVRKMLLSGAIYQFSFAYDVIDRKAPNEAQKAAGVENVLTKLDVFEISVVTVPANQNAVATEVKAIEPETKQGRRNSKADEDVIRQIRDLAQSLLDNAEGDDIPENQDAETEKAADVGNVATEDPRPAGNSIKAAELLEKIKNIMEEG